LHNSFSPLIPQHIALIIASAASNAVFNVNYTPPETYEVDDYGPYGESWGSHTEIKTPAKIEIPVPAVAIQTPPAPRPAAPSLPPSPAKPPQPPAPRAQQMPAPFIPDVSFWELNTAGIGPAKESLEPLGMNAWDINDIIRVLNERSWMWNYLVSKGELAKRKSAEKIKTLVSKVPSIIALLYENSIISAQRPLVSLLLMGSYPWIDSANDVDLVIVVAGEQNFTKMTASALPQKIREIVSGLETSFEVVGLETLKRAAKGEGVDMAAVLRRKLAPYSGAAPLVGADIFRISKPPIQNFSVMADDLRKEAELARWPNIASEPKKVEAKKAWRREEAAALDMWVKAHQPTPISAQLPTAYEPKASSAGIDTITKTDLLLSDIIPHHVMIALQVNGKITRDTPNHLTIMLKGFKSHPDEKDADNWLFYDVIGRNTDEARVCLTLNGYGYSVENFPTHLMEKVAQAIKAREAAEALKPASTPAPANDIPAKASSAGVTNEATWKAGTTVSDIGLAISEFVGRAPIALDGTALSDFKQRLNVDIAGLEELRGAVSVGIAPQVLASINTAEFYLDRISRIEKMAGELTNLQQTTGTVIINDREIPTNQAILLELFDKDREHLKALEEKLGIKIRLLSQFDSQADTSDNMIAISKERIDTIANLKYINIKTTIEGSYLPLEQIMVLAKGLLIYGVDRSVATESAIANIYSLIANGQRFERQLLDEFLEKGLFVLSLPAPTPVDPQLYDTLHKQAMAALIAA
jgi:hypothetical protein